MIAIVFLVIGFSSDSSRFHHSVDHTHTNRPNRIFSYHLSFSLVVLSTDKESFCLNLFTIEMIDSFRLTS